MSKQETIIKRQDFIALLLSGEAVKGITFISADWATVPRINKTLGGRGTGENPYHDKVLKVTKGAVGMLPSDKFASAYETAVRKRQGETGREVDFQVSERKWGTKVPGVPLTFNEKNGEYYLNYIAAQKGVDLPKAIEQDYGIKLTEQDIDNLGSAADLKVRYEPIHAPKVAYIFEEKVIEKSEIIGLQESNGGKQGGLNDEQKVVYRTVGIKNLNRISLNGRIFKLID